MGHKDFSLTSQVIKMKFSFDNLLRNTGVEKKKNDLLFILISTTGKIHFNKYLKKKLFGLRWLVM